MLPIVAASYHQFAVLLWGFRPRQSEISPAGIVSALGARKDTLAWDGKPPEAAVAAFLKCLNEWGPTPELSILPGPFNEAAVVTKPLARAVFSYNRGTVSEFTVSARKNIPGCSESATLEYRVEWVIGSDGSGCCYWEDGKGLEFRNNKVNKLDAFKKMPAAYACFVLRLHPAKLGK